MVAYRTLTKEPTMLKFLRRTVATGAMAAVLTAGSAVMGIGVTAANAYWIETGTDHVDLVVDWYEVKVAATSSGENYDECRAVHDAGVSSWRVDPERCAEFVLACALMADGDVRYQNHPIRVSFYFDRQECAVIGVG
jgi:hypothetical protein